MTMNPPDFHPIYNFAALNHWVDEWISVREAASTNEDSSSDPDYESRNLTPTHRQIEDGAALYQRYLAAENYFIEYCKVSDEHALEACRYLPQLIMFVTERQKDDDNFAYAILKHYQATPDEIVGAIFWGEHYFSSRLTRELHGLRVGEALEWLGSEREIQIEKHRLESITRKPFYRFDSLTVPKTVSEMTVKQKMRMKI